MKTHLCAIAKNEYPYIRDWVEYHLAIGFDKIVIYDNNNHDGERYDSLLSDRIGEGTVEIRDRRGLTGQQCKVYNEYYAEGDFDWLGIVDIDEFITFNPYSKIKTVQDLINAQPEADSISLYWMCYGDNGELYADTSVPVTERFREPMPVDCTNRNHSHIINVWPKSIHRKGLDVVLCEHFISKVLSGDVNIVDALGRVFTHNPNASHIKDTYNVAYVRHYMTKTVSEWYRHKIKRGHADSDDGENNNDVYSYDSNVYGWNYGFDSFFAYNDFTQEKVDYLNTLGYNVKIEFKPVMVVNVFCNTEEDYAKLSPYLDNIHEVCTPKFIYSLNQCNGFDDIGAFSVYSDRKIVYADYDLLWLRLFGYSESMHDYDNTTVNGFINIGFPLCASENDKVEFLKQMDKLFGKTERLRLYLQKCVQDGFTVVDADSLLSVDDMISNCPSISGLVEEYSKFYGDGKPKVRIRNNVFITPFRPLWDKVVNGFPNYKIEVNSDIENNLYNNTLSHYHALQCAYPLAFKKYLTVE